MAGLNTNSSNDFYIPAFASNYAKKGGERISDVYKIFDEDRYSSIEPEIHFNCVEQVRSWIGKQETIFGAVMNIGDASILEKLANTKQCCLTVNYSEWMANEDSNTYKICAPYYDKIDANPDSRIAVFYNKKTNARMPDLMHHKFMVGWEEEGNNASQSLLFGSYNMSYSSPQNLDSILLFRQNSRLCRTFLEVAIVLNGSSERWLNVKKCDSDYTEFITYINQFMKKKSPENQREDLIFLQETFSSIGRHRGVGLVLDYLSKKYDDFGEWDVRDEDGNSVKNNFLDNIEAE